MATQGSTALQGFWIDFENRLLGMPFTLAAESTLNSIQVRLRETTTNNEHIVLAAVYSGNTFVSAAASGHQDVQTTTDGNVYTFAFTATVLPAGAYNFVVFGNNAAGSIEINGDFATGGVTDDNVFSHPTWPNPADLVAADFPVSLLIDYTEGAGGGAATITNTSPQTNPLTVNGRAASMNPFTNVLIRDVLINEARSPVTNRTGMSLVVWFSGSPVGAPDLSYSALTTDANGTASWNIAPGSLAYGQPVFFVATDGNASLSEYTCQRMIPIYQ